MTSKEPWKPNKELFGSLLSIDKAEFSKCLEPALRCTSRAIRAHSVQNSSILDRLEQDGHVVGLIRSVTLDHGPHLNFGTVGRNRATTFTGLCAHHDHLIFAPIDRNEPRFDDHEYLFLLSYRAAFRELHATMAGAAKTQLVYAERVKRGLDLKDLPSAAGMLAVQRFMVSWETYLYKALMDAAYVESDFATMAHEVITLSVDQPTVAACSLFSVDDIHVRDDVLRIHLNVFPLSQHMTVVVFSYLRSDITLASSFLRPILQASGEQQQYEISRLLLNFCENFVLSPKYFDQWTEKKKNTVRRYFIETLFKNDLRYESPELCLF